MSDEILEKGRKAMCCAFKHLRRTGASGSMRRSGHRPKVPGLSRSRITALIKDGHCVLDGAPHTNPADQTAWRRDHRSPFRRPKTRTRNLKQSPLDILFEDDALIVINKPAGLVVHPGAGNPSGTLVNALLHHCGDSLSGIGGVKRPASSTASTRTPPASWSSPRPIRRTSIYRPSSPIMAAPTIWNGFTPPLCGAAPKRSSPSMRRSAETGPTG
jgi:hypothetical protein